MQHTGRDDVTALRHRIGLDNMLWGNDFPHSESTWPKSMEGLDTMFAGVPDNERRQLTYDNAVSLFRFEVSA